MALQHWKKLKQRKLFEHPRLNVYEDDIELPNGTKSTYLHFGTKPRIGSVTLIAIREDDKILLQKELSYPTGEFLWQWPGGAVDPGEEVLVAANRELQEETGFHAGSLEIIGEYYTDNRRAANKQCVAIARKLTEKPLPPDEGEAFEDKWATPDEIQQMIIRGEIVNVCFLAAWTLFTAHQSAPLRRP